MRFSPLLLLVQSVALSAALLIPPPLSDEEVKRLMFPSDLLGLHHQRIFNIVRLPCKGCSYKEEGVDTDLVLEFSAKGPAFDAMTLNSHALLPVEFPIDGSPYTAVQMPRDVDIVVYMHDKERFPTVKIDNIMVIGEGITSDGKKEYSVELSILAVDHKKVDLDTVKATFYESVDGKFDFGPLAVSAGTPTGQACGGNLKCMIGKMMNKFRGAAKSIPRPGRKGCNKKLLGFKPVESLNGDMPPHPPHGPGHRLSHHGPHHGPHHHHHHGPHHHHPSVFHRIIGQVLLPIFVGILAGMTVSLLGLVIGHIFVMLWRRVRGQRVEDGEEEEQPEEGRCGKKGGCFGRRRRERKERARLAAMDGDVESGKALLAAQDAEEEVEAPPAYKDEVVEVVEAVEKE